MFSHTCLRRGRAAASGSVPVRRRSATRLVPERRGRLFCCTPTASTKAPARAAPASARQRIIELAGELSTITGPGGYLTALRDEINAATTAYTAMTPPCST